MNQFPPYLAPTRINKSTFPAINTNIVLGELRSKIAEFIVRGNEKDHFALGDFYKSHSVPEKSKDAYTKQIVKELTHLGWKCRVIPGNSDIFIYSSTNSPLSHSDLDKLTI